MTKEIQNSTKEIKKNRQKKPVSFVFSLHFAKMLFIESSVSLFFSFLLSSVYPSQKVSWLTCWGEIIIYTMGDLVTSTTDFLCSGRFVFQARTPNNFPLTCTPEEPFFLLLGSSSSGQKHYFQLVTKWLALNHLPSHSVRTSERQKWGRVGNILDEFYCYCLAIALQIYQQ